MQNSNKISGMPIENTLTEKRAFPLLNFTGQSQICEVYQKVEIRNIGVLLQSRQGKNILSSPFYSAVLKEIKVICARENINLVYSDLPVDEQGHTLACPEVSIERRLDSLLVIGMHLESEASKSLDHLGVPVVLLDSSSEVKNYDAIEIANYQGAYDAVSFLIKQGHKKIAIAGSSALTFPGIFDRRRGYIDALCDFDIKNQFFIDSPFNPVAAYRSALTFLKKENRVTAVFCVSDWIAMAVMRAARELGLVVNRDISLMGFNDILIASHMTPALTTMHVDLATMGRMSINLIKNRIQYPGNRLIKVALRPNLVIRQSVQMLQGVQ